MRRQLPTPVTATIGAHLVCSAAMNDRAATDVLEVLGVPATGTADLDREGRAVLDTAEVIIATPRLLQEVRADAELIPLPSPLRTGLVELVTRHAGRRIVVLASGDPLVAGIGTTLIELFGAARVRIHPAISSVALARARMGWPAETCAVVRPTRGAQELTAQCYPGARLIVLSWDRQSPAEIAARLVEVGLGSSRMTLWSDLGTEQEQRIDGTAESWCCDAVPALQLVCIECSPALRNPNSATDFETYSTLPGLPDDSFDHDGQSRVSLEICCRVGDPQGR